MNKFILVYAACINILGFIIMGIDKARARKKQWRIPERRLFGVAIIFGSVGSLLGMYYFHHKTKHIKFIIGIPCILLVQLFILYKINFFIL